MHFSYPHGYATALDFQINKADQNPEKKELQQRSEPFYIFYVGQIPLHPSPPNSPRP